MPLGLYISVPFCRTKCSYCNFASDVFSKAVFQRYVDRVCSDLEHAAQTAATLGGQFDSAVDSIFLGGGTPTVLETGQLQALFTAVEKNFQLQPGAEVTVECAPGTLSPAVLETLQRCGVNRVSLGVQSFVDQEAASVGRIHKSDTVGDDIARLRAAGISNINVDLIAGLPHQSNESWGYSVQKALDSEVPHVSVYMLEVDEDSRLGREVLAGGTKYHAHFVPDDDLTADLYVAACEKLDAAGVAQYEISNFARAGFESRHNLKYWTRRPYMGFGVDAHSMLYAAGGRACVSLDSFVRLKAQASMVVPTATADSVASIDAPGIAGLDEGNGEDELSPEGHGFSRAVNMEHDLGPSPWAIRFAAPESLDAYISGPPIQPIPVSGQAALEEAFFLGLRLTRGVDFDAIAKEFGGESVAGLLPIIEELVEAKLLQPDANVIRLTARGRLVSNEVFEHFLAAPAL